MSKKIIAPFVLAFVLGINLFLGLSRLENYSSVDEPYWTYGRTSKFWTSVAAHKWKSTNVNDKPGITVAILSGFGLTKYDPMQYKSLRGQNKTDQQLTDMNNINFYFRLPIFLACVLLLPLFYFLLKKLLGQTTALIAFSFIGLSPILLGISLIINPDSLLWVFLPISLLSYLVFQNTQKRNYLYMSGFFLGLSLLTKYVANILYIFFFLLPFLEYLFAKEKPALRAYLKKAAIDYAILVAISMLTFFVLYPAAWVNLKVLLEGTFLSKAFKTTWPIFALTIAIIAFDALVFKSTYLQKFLQWISRHQKLLMQFVTGFFLVLIFIVLLNTYAGMKPFDLVGIISSPKGIGSGNMFEKFSGALLADTYGLIFGISPLVFLAMLFALASNFRTTTLKHFEERKIVFYFTAFILFYYFASSVNNVIATVRYQIILYPLAFIIAAIGVSQILKLPVFQKTLRQYAMILLLFVFVLSGIFSIRPFYFAYASSLLPNKYLLNLKDMGDGSWEAASYLNALPNAENLTIWSDKGAVCAAFKGTCMIGFTKKIRTVHFDYVVTSSGRESRTLKLSRGANDYLDFKKAYATNDTAEKIIIGGRANNYVKIINADAIYKQTQN